MNSAPASVPLHPTPLSDLGPPPAGRWAPWRSAAPGWLVAAGFVVAGVPLFLRMPLWVDVTLYDVAARTVLTGGVHYRDVFDTNPPGFVWALCLVRTLFGPGPEVVRAVDLVVVAATVGLLLRWARAGGATSAGVAWAAAGATGFYLFLSEFNHGQRDVWMMLPAVAAAGYRLRRVGRARARPVTDGWVFRTALVEGAVWGLAAWIKPHIIVVAAAAWAVTQGRLAGSRRGGAVRRSAADLGGAFAGGLLVGGAGLGWLLASGTWPYMYEVFTEWNTSYVSQILAELSLRCELQLGYFPPWSLMFVAVVPLAVLNVLDARPWSAGGPGATVPGPGVGRLPGWLYAHPAADGPRFARGVLAAVYLAWAGMALLLQRNFHYVHVPETLLMLAVLAANRWAAVVVPVLGLQAGVMAWVAAVGPSAPRWEDQPPGFRYLVWQYPDRAPNRFRYWPACFAREVPGEVRNGVAFQTDSHAGVNWSELEEVAAFLRGQGVTAGDTRVMCWHDSPHPLYLLLDLRPPIRFMHLSTAIGMGPRAYPRVRGEVAAAAPRVRFVVSDLVRVGLFFPPDAQARMREPGPDLLPPILPRECREAFPMNQPAVFRSGHGRGRYVVHVLTNPIGEVDVPGWPDPD